MRVVHLTSVHHRWDTRVFLKECCSLAASGNEVNLVVADALPDEIKNGVRIYGLPKEKNRFKRIIKTPIIVYKIALKLKAEIYHVHDPELIYIGLLLKRRKKIVVFDAHEDIPKQLLSKPYLNVQIRRLLSVAFKSFERWTLINYHLIIAATPAITKKYNSWHPFVVSVNNYPILQELVSINSLEYKQRPKLITYVGGISVIRGIYEIVKAMELVSSSTKLSLVGTFSSLQLAEKIRTINGWSSIINRGYLDRASIKDVFSKARAGLVIFHPVPNHLDAQPNKLFEYMSAGIPVIASDFPLWRKIVEGSKCGLCVDPLDPKAIAKAIDWIIEHPKEAEEMGANGQKAVREHYNWDKEALKLLGAYKTLSCQG